MSFGPERGGVGLCHRNPQTEIPVQLMAVTAAYNNEILINISSLTRIY